MVKKGSALFSNEESESLKEKGTPLTGKEKVKKVPSTPEQVGDLEAGRAGVGMTGQRLGENVTVVSKGDKKDVPKGLKDEVVVAKKRKKKRSG
jgi:hypothetical protein